MILPFIYHASILHYRRMATDRIFLVLILLVVIGMIVAIAVYFMKPKLEGKPVIDLGTKIG